MCPASPTFAGTRWQVPQGTAAAMPLASMWPRWAPTPRSVAAFRPRVSIGGAGLSALPWQVVHGFSGGTSCSEDSRPTVHPARTTRIAGIAHSKARPRIVNLSLSVEERSTPGRLFRPRAQN